MFGVSSLRCQFGVYLLLGLGDLLFKSLLRSLMSVSLRAERSNRCLHFVRLGGFFGERLLVALALRGHDLDLPLLGALLLCSAVSEVPNTSSPCIPSSSAIFMRNWFLSSNTRFRPCSMKLSNFTVNFAMRSRSSSKPKLILGRDSAIEGAFADVNGGFIALVESDGSNTLPILFASEELSC
jgi:hypothetical protein